MTKAQELQLLTTLIAQLPADSYVHDILTDAVPFIESSIRSDIATHEPISGIITAQREETVRLARMKHEATELTAQLDQKRRELDRLSRQLDAVRADIRTLARCV